MFVQIRINGANSLPKYGTIVFGEVGGAVLEFSVSMGICYAYKANDILARYENK